MNQLMTKTISFSKDSDLGYGMGLLSESYKGLRTVFHGGGTGGYRAYIMHVPKYNLSIVTLGNQEDFDGLLIVQDLFKIYLEDFIVEPEPVNIFNTEKEMKEFEGTYKLFPGQYWTIKIDKKNLYFGGDKTPLPLIGDKKFKFIYFPTSYFTFHSNSLFWRIADFNYHCEIVGLNRPVLNEIELWKYVGIYNDESLNVFYEISIFEDNLEATHLTNGQIMLSPLSAIRFSAGSPLGELNFHHNLEGKVNGFVLDG